MKKIYLMLLPAFLFLALISNAQVSSYIFTAGSGTFNPVAGGTPVATSTSVADFLEDTKTSLAIPIGFTFNYDGLNYTNVVAVSDGFLSFNTSATSAFTNNLATSIAARRPLVAPLWDDLDGASGSGAASYITEGAVGSRVFTMEWLNWQWNYNATGATISFQVKLYEGTNRVEFIYRQEAGAVNSASASIGITGAATGTGNYLSLNNSTAAPTVSSSTETTTISAKPATGQIYAFEPNLAAMDYCNLQFPATATIPFGGGADVYTQGFEPGVTESAGAGAGISVWIGTSTTNTNPNTWTNWVPATFNVQVGNNDEYKATIGSSFAPGTYYYAARWQYNGGQYRYGGYPNGFWDGTTQVSGVLTVTPPPAPANDDCANAVSLVPGANLVCAGQTAGTTLSATQSIETAPTCGATGVNDDVWYSFVATSGSHIITLSGVSGSTDMAMAAYSGSCGSLVALACSDPEVMTLTGLVPAQAYFVRVWTWVSTATTAASFNICITTPPPPPANDICAGAIVIPPSGPFPYLTGATSIISATNTSDPTNTCQANSNKGIWYSFTPNATGSYIISSCQSVAPLSNVSDNVLSIFTSATGCTGPFTQVACDDDGCSTLANQAVITTSLTAGTTYYIVAYGYATNTGDIQLHITAPAACPAPTLVSAGGLTSTGASITWTGTGTFILEYGPTGFTPGTGATAGAGGTVINPATSPQAITGLTATTVYQVYVRQDCTGTGNGYSLNSTVVAFTTLAPPPANDEASGAISITVDAVCTGGSFSNAAATLSANEARIACKGSQTTGSQVWFKFVAPASGFVKVSTDVSGGTLADTRIALFSASDVNDYSTFTGLACDDDNGSTVTTSSTLYANGLTPGTTYYVAVDQWNGTGTGTFCVEVREFTSSMLSAIGNCTAGQDLTSYRDSYTGWLSVTDNSGNLRAMVRNPAGTGTSTYTYTNAININAGAVRQSSQTATFYLDRNYRITNSAATNIQVQFFFLNTELAALTTADGTTLPLLAATRQLETVAGCQNNFLGSNGAGIVLPQTSNGTAGAVSWIQVITPGFSNFYLHNSAKVVPVTIEYFKGSKQSSGNLLDWKVACYNSPTVSMVLERSDDARKFEPINSITETATRCLQPFSFVDASPLAGVNYYRLKTIDADGKVSYSTTVALINKDKGFEITSLMPNPVKATAILSVISAKKTSMQVLVSDLAGRQLSKQMVTLLAGSNQVPLKLSNLAAGTYQVTGITADGTATTLRFVKE